MSIKTICCECGSLMCDGPQPDHEVSHGFCKRCRSVIKAFLEGKPYDTEYAKKLKTIS